MTATTTLPLCKKWLALIKTAGLYLLRISLMVGLMITVSYTAGYWFGVGFSAASPLLSVNVTTIER